MSRSRRKQRTIQPGQRTLAIAKMPRARKVARSVLVRLAPYGRLGTGAKILAKETGYPLRTVYRAISHLVDSGEVIKVPAGFASAAVFHDLTADPTATLGFQNIRFAIDGWLTDPPPPCKTARPWHTKDGGLAGPIEMTEFNWEGRVVRLKFYPQSGTLEGIIAATVPIPNAKAGELYGWLSAMLGLNRGEKARITFIEVNADHRLVRLEENYIELRDLPGVSRVIYQKTEALRHELRLSDPRTDDGKPLPLERALALLVEGSPEARMERLLKLEIELARLQGGLMTESTAQPRQPEPLKDLREAGYG